MSLHPHRFPKSRRLTRSDDFRRVQSSGRRIKTRSLTVLCCPGLAEASRVGFTVSRKVGNAVVRNKVKRRLREAVRRHGESLAGSCLDVVVVASPRAAEIGYPAIEAEVISAFSRLCGGVC